MSQLTRARAALWRWWRSPVRVVGSITAVALLGAAVWAVGRDPAAWGAVASARGAWWLWSAAIALPALNWLIVALSFQALLNRYGRVETGEILALIGSSWLLNYLPMRPGLVGRVAYHKVVNGIAVRSAALVTIIGMAATGVGAVIVLAVALALGPQAGTWAWAAGLGLPAVTLGVAGAALWGSGSPMWRLGVALALRYLDVLVWAARYAVTFALVGSPITPDTALALAVVSQIAMLVPFAGNGLGLREWAIGLTAASLAGVGGVGGVGAGAGPEAGLAADLVNRAVEVAVAVPVGLLGGRAVSRRLRARLESRRGHAAAPDGIGQGA